MPPPTTGDHAAVPAGRSPTVPFAALGPERLRRSAWRAALPWLLSTAAGLLLVVALAEWLIHRQLLANADEEGENWVEFVQQSVPEIEVALGGGELRPRALDRLKVLSNADEVFRFRLYSASGDLMVDSVQLHGGAAQPPSPPEQRRVLSAASTGEALLHVSHEAIGPIEHFAVAVVPVRIDGRLIGVFEVYIDQTERADGIQQAFVLFGMAVALLTGLIGASAGWRSVLDSRRRLRFDARARHLASRDPLTGVFNRRSLMHSLHRAAERARAEASTFAVLAIDLDRFKEINDTHGHAAGDETLRVVSARLQALLSRHDALARLGGDEFVILRREDPRPEALEGLARAVLECLSRPIEYRGLTLQCGGSVGLTLYGPSDDDVVAVMRRADAALYQAKEEGRGRCCWFDALFDMRRQEERRLAAELRAALAQGQLELEFQARFDLHERRLSGYEALLRWNHPTRGLVLPSRFLPMAESGGLMGAFSAWMLHRACQAAADWPEELTLSVNMAREQLMQDTLAADVMLALGDSGLAPDRLALEIGEPAPGTELEPILARLQPLRDLGVKIVVDHFGAGPAGLALLRRGVPDRVKIDRSFVSELGISARTELIVTAMIDLCRTLRIEVAAEGVESIQQQELLARLGCDEVQGFLLARPTTAGRLTHQKAPQALRAAWLPDGP